MSEEPKALGLHWVVGLSNIGAGGVLNLTADDQRECICYAAAHTAVLYSLPDKRQTMLQGHCNSISCLCASADKSIVVTADVGPDSLVVLWDPRSANPLRTIQSPHRHGTIAMDITADGAYLVTLGAEDADSGEQVIALWDLHSTASAEAAIRTNIPAGDMQLTVHFNSDNTAEIMTNGRQRVYFWGSQLPHANSFKYYSPPLCAADFKQAIRDYTASTFVPRTTSAVTGTVDGDIVVWEEQGSSALEGMRASDRRAAKVIRIHNTPITHLTCIDRFIVSGGADGFVRFFDPHFRLAAWFEDLSAGEISSISFSAAGMSVPAGAEEGDLNLFMAPDFLVATSQGQVLAVQAGSFEDVRLPRKGTCLLQGALNSVTSIAAHPLKPEFAIIGDGSSLQVWDFLRHTNLKTRQFEGLELTCLCYSRDGTVLAVGCSTGQIHLLTDGLLATSSELKSTKKEIVRLAFSSSGRQLAVACEDHAVMLFRQQPQRDSLRWEYMGRHLAHHARICGLCFGEAPSGQTKLFSLGRDGRIAEYDLENSSIPNGLKMVTLRDVAAAGTTPTALTFAPPMPYFMQGSADTLLVTADDAFKLRLYSADSQSCVATYLGPTFSGPLEDLVVFRSGVTDQPYVAYCTADRVVGLLAWPLDGDASRALGLIAHPRALAGMAVSHDGRKLLTAGRADGVINIWEVNTTGLDATCSTPEQQCQTWANMLNAQDPGLLDEIRDYFYYAQIRAQGDSSSAPRVIDGQVPVSMIPDLMRGLGHYPSAAEMTDMLEDLKYAAASRQQAPPAHITFNQFLALYINYRHVRGVELADIQQAFQTLGADGEGRLGREDLVDILTSSGEPMSAEEVATCLQALTGHQHAEDAMPGMVAATEFADQILGFQEDPAEPILVS
ncbi:hypothetical protein WJX72_008365 [[Myrmecia] bisecta]|uniref:Cilia- and flagella-associated protein 251 n=1 Tax=[Myrmecia] bisecta TaxID=41462 RepID=A0AAW1R7Y2_9CHLO